MSNWLPIILVALAIVAAGYVNYAALAHLEQPKSKTRNLAVYCGGIGLTFVILSPFAPLLGLAFYFNEGSERASVLFPIIWIGAAAFTVLSLLAIITHAFADKRPSA